MLVFKTPIVWPNSISWVLLMIAISLFGFSLQLLLTMGFQRETASRGSLATYTRIVFAEISDRVIFYSKLSGLSLIGTAIVLTSAIYVAVSDCYYASTLLMTVTQFMKNRKASGEATGHIRIRSMGKRGVERLQLDANDTMLEESRGLVSDDYGERSTLDLMENVQK